MFKLRTILAIVLALLILPALLMETGSGGKAAQDRRFALVIGIGPGYMHPEFRTLQYPEQDAGRMAEALQRLGFEVVDKVVGAAATAQGIKIAVGRLAQKADHPDDTVIVYYSGHGAVQRSADREVPSLVPSDADPKLPSTFITDTELGQWLSFVQSRKVLLILDSCYSAGIGGGEKRLTAPEQMTPQDVQTRLRRIKQAEFVGSLFRSTVILASSQARETSKETDKGGIFTYYLLQGLGDENKGTCPACEEGTNQVTPRSWLQYTTRGVIASVDQEPQLQAPPAGEQLTLFIPWIKPLPGATVRPYPSPAATVVPVPSPGVSRLGSINLKLNVRGADVAINGATVQSGVGPEVRLEKQSPGSYTLEVVKPGYLPRSLKVTVHEGEQVKLTVNLSPRPKTAAAGQLSVAIDPAGARVVLEGKAYKAPITGLSLVPGTYKVRISAKGYWNREEQVVVQADKDNKFTFKLKKEAPQDFYAQGRQAYLLFSPEGFAEAVKWYQKAIALDPKYAPAHAGLAEALVLWGHLKRLRGEPYQDAFDQAYAHSQKALELNPKLPEVQRAFGRASWFAGKPGAEEAVRKALEANAEDAETWHALWFVTGNDKDPDHDYLRKALQFDPNLGIARLDRGIILAELKRYEEAAAEFWQALQLNPRNIEAYLQLGGTLFQLKRYEDAAAEYRQVIQLQPRYANAHLYLAGNLYQLKRYEEAVAECRQAIQLQPNSVDAHVLLGGTLFQLKRYEEAMAEYRQAIQLQPGHANAHLYLAGTLFHLKRYEEAAAEYREAIRLNPDQADAHLHLGSILAELKRHEEAAAEYQQAIRLNPGQVDGRIKLGDTLCDLKRHEEAVTEYREAIRLNPGRADVHYRLALALAVLRRHDEAIAEYRESIRLAPNDAGSYVKLADTLAGLERYDEAIAEYQQAVRISPDNAEIHFSLANAQVNSRHYEEATAEYRQALRLNPNFAMAYNNLGNTLARLKRYEEAIAEYRQAIRIAPNDADVHINLGNVLLPLDRYKEAIAEFREALRINPDSNPARQNLAVVRYLIYQIPGIAWWNSPLPSDPSNRGMDMPPNPPDQIRQR